jgi:hypothetical protein
MNNFHKTITLPIKFIEPERLSQLKSSNVTNNKMVRSDVNPEFHDWIESFGLRIKSSESRFFISNPYQQYSIHADSSNPTIHKTKLNIMFNSFGTEMIWFKAKNESFYNDQMGIRVYPKHNCTEIFKTLVDTPCLINGSQIHTLVNSDNRGLQRRCYSLCLANLKTNELVTFEKASTIFQ